MHSGSSRDGIPTNFQTTIYDPSLPSGFAPFLRRDSTVYVGQNHLFRYSSELSRDSLIFQNNLAESGYTIFNGGSSSSDLNLWTYSIFKQGDLFYIIASPSTEVLTEKPYTYLDPKSYKLFIGNEETMEEYSIQYDPQRRILFVPDRGLAITIFQTHSKIPAFDKITGVYMGNIENNT